MIPSNLQAEWARLLIDSFAAAGVREVVISPGSRSTPFVLAAVKHPKLSCRDVVDERSAAYFALGQARVSGRPTLLLPTSGTAVANYYPAVIEAAASQVPLVVLSADRPVELAACGANQTIDQVKLFGDHIRAFFDLGAAEGSERALRALRRTVAQAVFASRYPLAGPVHLNARASMPLEPGAAESAEERELATRFDAFLERPAPQPRAPRRMPQAADVEELAKACRSAESGLIVCGPAGLARARSRSLIAELGRRTGFPVLREAASQLRFCPELAGNDVLAVDGFDALLKSERFRAAAAPELVLQIGRCPTSAAWGRYLAEHAGCRHWLLGAGDWHDAESTATDLLFADLEDCLARLTTRLPAAAARAAETEWQARWRAAGQTARRCVDAELAVAGDALTEGGVARATAAALPEGSLLAVGNSLPIREVDAYCPGTAVDLRVLCQRGASGIDGVVSGALGAASLWRHRVALLVGDVSFLHDVSALQAARHVLVPMVVIVVQNRGGRIFEQLPLAAHPAAGGDVLEHWTTPHEIDLAPAAAMHGLAFERAERRSDLEAALDRALGRPGVTLIEAMVPPHGAAEQNRGLQQRIEAALGTAEPRAAE